MSTGDGKHAFLMTNLYRCPSYFQCTCAQGSLVSLTTVRRHRDIAQLRPRRETGNNALCVALPIPIAISDEIYGSRDIADGTSDESSSESCELSSLSIGNAIPIDGAMEEDQFDEPFQDNFSPPESLSIAPSNTFAYELTDAVMQLGSPLLHA